MCTVTFLPLDGKHFILTSNRDEQRTRKKALPPQYHQVHGQQVCFPRDGQAHGTWIATSPQGFTLVLLNGAFESHIPHPPYRLSRGLMLLDFFRYNNPHAFASQYDFTGIEPFTLLILRHQQHLELTQIRWNAHKQLQITSLDASQPGIWSSATLYSLAVRQRRKAWFEEWLLSRRNQEYELEEILRFHHFDGNGDLVNGLLMDRQVVSTISITAVTNRNGKAEMIYEELNQHESSTIFTA
jgi:uncharacterized protein with NRDE domain